MNRWPLFFAALIALNITGSARGDDDDPVYRGISDDRVLPMLRGLSYRHGGMNVPAADGRYLYDLIRERKYVRGLEIGTSNGYSTLWIGLAMKHTSGSVVTVEIDRLRGMEARENFRKAGLEGTIEQVTGNALSVIPALEGTFDFVFIDAWKDDYIKYLGLVRNRMRRGGVITAHNVVSQAGSMEDFLRALRSDPGLRTEIIRVSGQGISVSHVR